MWRPLQTNFQRWQANLSNTIPRGGQPVNDREKYAAQGYVGSFRKGLPTVQGVVDVADTRALLKALRTRNFQPLKDRAVGLVDPLAGYSNDLFGPDSSCTRMIRGPAALDSVEMAWDMQELYAMALLRDVPFDQWEHHPLVAQVTSQLRRTPSSLFRYEALPGPFVSQLLVQQQWKPLHTQNYLTDWASYDLVHSGYGERPLTAYQDKVRYPLTLRDLASHTWMDYPVQVYQEAVLWLYQKHPKSMYNPNKGRPYDGFVNFNQPFALELLNKASALALRVCWYHKWLVHCSARPEEVGAEVERLRSGLQSPYPGQPHDELLQSSLVALTVQTQGNALLSSAFPEGCPIHPSFPAGHSIIAGACSTILKALTKWNYELTTPVIPNVDGSILLPWTGGSLLLGPEINKLAYNTGIARSAAGVHYRHDSSASFELGEQLALRILKEVKTALRRKDVVFTVHTFNHRLVEI